MSLLSLAIILSSVFFNAVAQIFMKLGAQNKESLLETGEMILFAYLNNYILIGLLFYAISIILWIEALTKVQVSIAYPMLSLGYIFVTIMAYFFFKEEITTIKVIGLTIIILGIVILANA